MEMNQCNRADLNSSHQGASPCLYYTVICSISHTSRVGLYVYRETKWVGPQPMSPYFLHLTFVPLIFGMGSHFLY
jgi:hypothetical protein